MKCGWVQLEPENFLTYHLIQEYSGFLICGDGSINSHGLELIMKLEKIDEHLQAELCKDISIYLIIALKAQRGESTSNAVQHKEVRR